MRTSIVVVIAASLASARVEADCHRDEHSSEPWLSPGVTLGVGDDSHAARGFFVGGELSALVLSTTTPCSLIPIPEAEWIGVYGDGVYYPSDGTARWTLGPELGWDFLGLDGGIVLKRQGGTFGSSRSITS